VDHLDCGGDRESLILGATERSAAHHAEACSNALSRVGVRRLEQVVRLAEVVTQDAVDRQIIAVALESLGFYFGDERRQGLVEPLIETGWSELGVQRTGPSLMRSGA
jgi:hypothetical protein